MKIRKIIDKHIHEIEFLKIAQLEKKLVNNISNSDILIFDRNIAEIRLIKKLLKRFPKRSIVIKGHEKIKNIHNYSSVIEKIIKLGVQRKTIIYSFGGGTLGDLSGFLASTILRGVEHIMIPTSLLAMVDSSIGGKTGINSKFGKNLIGTFYLPKKVFICSDFLKSLPKREIACGYAEIIKYSLINSKQLHKLLIKRSKGDINKIIKLSINSKLKYVTDFRAILNFGHTIGHAIENSNFYKGNLKHGEAISLGMIVELKISSLLNYYPKRVDNLIEILKKFNLPVNYNKYVNKKTIPSLIKKITFDKKVINEDVNIALIGKNGGFIKKISIRDLKSTLNQIK
jgi:3-dehydroquinate synthetase